MFNKHINTDGSNKEFIFANIAVKNIDFALISLDYILNHSLWGDVSTNGLDKCKRKAKKGTRNERYVRSKKFRSRK